MADKTYSYRVGFKTGWPFPNKGVIVQRGITEDQRHQIETAGVQFVRTLRAAGLTDLADNFVLERRD